MTTLNDIEKKLSVNIKKKQPQDVAFKKTVLKKFAIVTGKHLYWSIYLIILQKLNDSTLLKRESNTGVFL